LTPGFGFVPGNVEPFPPSIVIGVGPRPHPCLATQLSKVARFPFHRGRGPRQRSCRTHSSSPAVDQLFQLGNIILVPRFCEQAPWPRLVLARSHAVQLVLRSGRGVRLNRSMNEHAFWALVTMHNEVLVGREHLTQRVASPHFGQGGRRVPGTV
jgi:hypothetical protein